MAEETVEQAGIRYFVQMKRDWVESEVESGKSFAKTTGWVDLGDLVVAPRTHKETVIKLAGKEFKPLKEELKDGPVRVRVLPLSEVVEGTLGQYTPPPELTVSFD